MAAVVRLADVCTHRKQPLINIKEYSEPLWSGGRYESASLDRKLGRNVAYKRICKLLVFGARGKVQHDHFLFFFIIIIAGGGKTAFESSRALRFTFHAYACRSSRRFRRPPPGSYYLLLGRTICALGTVPYRRRESND